MRNTTELQVHDRETILVGWYSNTSSSATRTVRSRNDDVQSFGARLDETVTRRETIR